MDADSSRSKTEDSSLLIYSTLVHTVSFSFIFGVPFAINAGRIGFQQGSSMLFTFTLTGQARSKMQVSA